MAISNGFRRGLIFLAFTGAMGCFVFVVWLAAITQQTPGDLPVIAPPAGPARVTPEFPGGMQVPNQDKEIFETFNEVSTEKASTLSSDLAEPDRSHKALFFLPAFLRNLPEKRPDHKRVDRW